MKRHPFLEHLRAPKERPDTAGAPSGAPNAGRGAGAERVARGPEPRTNIVLKREGTDGLEQVIDGTAAGTWAAEPAGAAGSPRGRMSGRNTAVYIAGDSPVSTPMPSGFFMPPRDGSASPSGRPKRDASPGAASAPASLAPQNATKALSPKTLVKTQTHQSWIYKGFAMGEAERRATVESVAPAPVVTTASTQEQGGKLFQRWRAQFSLELLGLMAEEFEQLPLRSAGRIGTRPRLERIVAQVLNVTKRTASEMLEAQTLNLNAQGRVELHGFPNFLQIFADGVQWLHRERAEFLWNPADLELIRQVYISYVKRAGRSLATGDVMPLSAIQKALTSLEVRGVATGWLAEREELLEEILQSITSTSDTQTLTHKEFLQIVCLAMHEREVDARQREFKSEESAREEAGFSAMELEDLRELHLSASPLVMRAPISERRTSGEEALPACGDQFVALKWLDALLRDCGVREITADEMECLKDIVLAHPLDLTAADPDADAGELVSIPFDTFIRWMDRILSHRICGLAREQPQSELLGMVGWAPPSDERRGFAATMLRDSHRRHLSRVARRNATLGHGGAKRRRPASSCAGGRPEELWEWFRAPGLHTSVSRALLELRDAREAQAETIARRQCTRWVHAPAVREAPSLDAAADAGDEGDECDLFEGDWSYPLCSIATLRHGRSGVNRRSSF